MSLAFILLTSALAAVGHPQFQLLALGETNLSQQKSTQNLLATQSGRSGNNGGVGGDPLKMIASALVNQFQATAGHFRDRWVHLPSSAHSLASSASSASPVANTRRPLLNLRDQSRFPGPRPPARVPNVTRRNRIMRALNSLAARMGPRNSIRVHNAFRDFAWRVLSTFSMPTPVIYELRRKHFYPADEDEVQDKFFDRNTTKTIRTRRQLSEPGEQTGELAAQARQDSDDDSEPENFRERLRVRLEDLLSLSRRSLFGRVVRLPALFPFKRQEGAPDEQEDDRDGPGGGGGKRNKRPAPLRWHRLASGRKRKEAERQMISINGKQYYVNDEGELKEMPPSRDAAGA